VYICIFSQKIRPSCLFCDIFCVYFPMFVSKNAVNCLKRHFEMIYIRLHVPSGMLAQHSDSC